MALLFAIHRVSLSGVLNVFLQNENLFGILPMLNYLGNAATAFLLSIQYYVCSCECRENERGLMVEEWESRYSVSR